MAAQRPAQPFLDEAASPPAPLPFGALRPRSIPDDAFALAMTNALGHQVCDSRSTLTALLADTGCSALPNGARGPAADG